MTIHTYCRNCEHSCGLLADVSDGRIEQLRPDPSDPICYGAVGCEHLNESVTQIESSERIRVPLRRSGEDWVESTWDEAFDDISRRLSDLREQSGTQSVGLSLGPNIERNSHGFIRSLSLALSLGTTQIFSGLSQGAGPRLRMAELMLGSPTPLLSDLSRAHYVVVLGGHQREGDWGPWNLGGAHERDLNHSRRTKGTKVVVVGPRKTALAESMDQFIAIRSGSEPFLLMGMLVAVVRGGWVDQQYIDDYCENYEALRDILEPWSVEGCAKECGIEPAQLSGLALKFSRAAMALVHPDYGTFSNAHATMGAWAWLTLHTVTANTLRPGGLYAHPGVIDIQSVLERIPTDGAPHTRVLDLPMLLMQAPLAALPDEILVPGEDRVRGLICVSDDPLVRLPDSERSREAFEKLDFLVCLAREQNATTAHADWILPVTSPWERADLQLVDHHLLPRTMLRWTPALVSPQGDARTEQAILGELAKRLRPSRKGSAWGTHVHLLGRLLGRTDLDQWMRRALEWSTDHEWSELDQEPHRIDEGDTDRSAWQVTTPSGRVQLLPAVVLDVLKDFQSPVTNPDFPHRLRTSLRPDRKACSGDSLLGVPDPGVAIHPDLGIADGAKVRVSTRHGSLETVAHHEPALREDCVDLPYGYGTDVMRLLSAARLDELCGTAAFDGVACRIEPC